MTKTAETLKKELSQLSQQDRADIASFLIHSLDEDVDEDVKEAWDRELTQRLTEINQGTAKSDTLKFRIVRIANKILMKPMHTQNVNLITGKSEDLIISNL